MKATATRKGYYTPQTNLPYPNAATRREIFQKILDLLLMAAIGIGAATVALFLIALT